MNHEPKDKLDAWHNGFIWGVFTGLFCGAIVCGMVLLVIYVPK